LKLASAGARLSKFEVMEPSLEEIFIDAVSKPAVSKPAVSQPTVKSNA